MKRDLANFQDTTFDVLVVGGGIHGSAAAWQCAAQGMKVGLIEKNDFGNATSANSLKIIHGGFRYLQHLNIKRMRESIVSRRIMSQISPHNVRALRCAIPLSGYGLRSGVMMRLALFLNDLISYDRNREVSEECRIPAGKVISVEQCRKIFPRVDWSGKSGGAIWYDAIALNSERLTLSFIRQAVFAGAHIANYTAMTKLQVKAGRVVGCQAYDSIGDRSIDISAKTVVVTGGADNDRLLGIHQSRKDIQQDWAKAVNIIVKKQLLDDTAIGLTGETDYVDKDAVLKKKGRFFFFVPWRGHTMIGTTYTFNKKHSAGVSACKADISEIIREVSSIFPEANVSESDVTKVHAGLVPAYRQDNSNDVQLVKETEIFDLGERYGNRVEGIFSVKSVKYTTAPIVAMDVAKKTALFLGMKYSKQCEMPKTKGQSASTVNNNGFKAYSSIVSRYGSDSESVLRYLSNDSRLICDTPAVYGEEIDYFIEEEMAQTLADVVFRRSDIATAACPDRDQLLVIARRMAALLDWDEKRIEAEVQSVEDTFLWNE